MVAAICPRAASRSLRLTSSCALHSFSLASFSSRFVSASSCVAWRTRDSSPAVRSSRRASMRLKLPARKANSPPPRTLTRAPSSPDAALEKDREQERDENDRDDPENTPDHAQPALEARDLEERELHLHHARER